MLQITLVTKHEIYILNQKNKICKLIKAFQLNESKPTYVPTEPGCLNNDSNKKYWKITRSSVKL